MQMTSNVAPVASSSSKVDTDTPVLRDAQAIVSWSSSAPCRSMGRSSRSSSSVPLPQPKSSKRDPGAAYRARTATKRRCRAISARGVRTRVIAVPCVDPPEYVIGGNRIDECRLAIFRI